MDRNFIEELNEFLGKAALAAYAGSGKEIESQRPGFIEFEHQEGRFSYRDSYTGAWTSVGQEVVWFDGSPIWSQSYGGGIKKEYHGDKELDRQLIDFLKKALSSGEKIKEFQPRGPKQLREGDWEYRCVWEGDIENFQGGEEILHKGDVVFTHHFFGGLIKH